jgi:hypothetical protein
MARNEGHVQGELAEFEVAADLVDQGCRVSYTHGEYKYDLVADCGGDLFRVQVKKANRDSDRPWKYRLFTDRYEEGDVDLFAGYVFEEDAVFYVPFEEVGSEFRINTKSSDEMSEANARRAKLIDDYTLERARATLTEG